MDDTAAAQERRPDGLVASTRRLFLVLVLISVALLIGPALHTPVGLYPAMALAWAAVIAAWLLRYRLRRSPVVLDLGEVAATAAIGVLFPDPAVVLTFVFPALWFRALYGTTRRLLIFGFLIAASVLAAAVLWPLVPGRADSSSVTHILFSGVPSVFVTTAVARYLAVGMFAREQAQRRDAALSRLGRGLLGITERSAIHRQAHACAAELCAITPGLRVLIVIAQDGALTVVDRSGSFAEPVDLLPAGVLPGPVSVDSVEAWEMTDTALLSRAAGETCRWMAMPLVEEPGWLLVGSPGRVPRDAMVALESMDNHVALALRNSYAHEDLATQAHMDALTGLANRAAFTSALQAALADPGSPVALLFLDLDDFKLVNDGLGHAAGDDLLRHVATRMRWAVGPQDLCARLGGDEFAVLMPDADATALPTAERLVELVAAPVTLKGQLAQVGASVGVAFSAGMGGAEGAEQLVQRADIAMYAAKAKGKNRVQEFQPGLLRGDDRAAFEKELAAAAGAGQLVVHYQPILAVTDGACVAVEALVRWQHPTRGLLAPADFIAAAERTGAIVGIGDVVLLRACADAAAWSRRFGRLDVHVNVSARQLTEPDFPDRVRSCIEEFGLAPRQLVVEITETMVLESDGIRSALQRLVEVGAAIAIDDFGTGYSALSTIRTLPLDVVKLDKSFIAGDSSPAADTAVVGAIVAMAAQLGLRVVAEGVERLDQQQFLENVGADAAQGFLHLRPTTAAEFTDWLLARQGRSTSRLSVLAPPRAG